MTNSNNNVEDCSYEVAPGKVLSEKYGLKAENRPSIKVNLDNVPPEFRYLIPFAETWGISDDLIRGDVIEKAGIQELQQLTEVMDQVDYDAYLEWLGQLDKAGSDYTEEFIAFYCLSIAASEAPYEIERRERKRSTST
jgi:hypothetical protein